MKRRLTSGMVKAATKSTHTCWNDRYCSLADESDKVIRKTHIAAHSDPFPDITIGKDGKE